MGREERKEEERPNYSFFQNSRREYFPCHHVSDIENFNCLFCYCPLYAQTACFRTRRADMTTSSRTF